MIRKVGSGASREPCGAGRGRSGFFSRLGKMFFIPGGKIRFIYMCKRKIPVAARSAGTLCEATAACALHFMMSGSSKSASKQARKHTSKQQDVAKLLVSISRQAYEFLVSRSKQAYDFLPVSEKHP